MEAYSSPKFQQCSCLPKRSKLIGFDEQVQTMTQTMLTVIIVLTRKTDS